MLWIEIHSMQDPESHFLRRALFGAVVACSLFGASAVPVGAADQPKDVAAAKAAFNAGLSLEAANDYGQALMRFREVAAFRPTPQAMYHIGRCLEKLGKWTEAVGAYRLAVEKAEERHDNTLRQQADDARTQLEQKLPKILIERGKGAEVAQLMLDGVPLGGSALNSPLPADPGAHQITATFPGRPPTNVNVVLAEGETKRVPIEMGTAPAIVPSATATTTPTGAPTEAGTGSTIWTRKTGYYIGGAGLASLAAAGVFLFLRERTINDLESHCSGFRCPASLRSTSDHGKTYTALADTFLAIGVVGLSVGIYLVARGDKKSEQAPASSPPKSGSIWIGPMGLGAGVGGVFE